MGEPQRTRLVGLDGLRGIAALSVIGYHVSNVLSPTMHRRAPELVFVLHQGLTLFFVLSGFLLYLGFAGRLVDGRPLPSLRDYAAARVLRLWPAYVTVLAVTSVGLGLAFVWPRGVGRVSTGSFVSDLTLLHSYSPQTIRSGLEVSWTLTVELTFYALLPLVAWGAARLGRCLEGWLRASLPIAVMLGIGLVGFVWSRCFTALSGQAPHGWSRDWQSVASRSLLMEGHLFAFGMLAALLSLAVGRGALAAPLVRGAAGVVAVVTAVTCIGDRRNDFADGLAGVAFAALLLVATVPAADGRAGLVGRLLDRSALRGLGAISYGVYLWHMTVVHAVDRWLPGVGSSAFGGYLVAFGAVAGASVALATVTYVGVERPAMRLRARLARTPRSRRPKGATASAEVERRAYWLT